MKNLFFVDVEAEGPCPAMGRMTEFGAVHAASRETFHGVIATPAGEKAVASEFVDWLAKLCDTRPIFVSDNPAFDWQWINDFMWQNVGHNPFGHSARRISDFYAGLRGDFRKTQEWKKLRVTPHDHNPVHDAMGNLEAFERLLKGER